MLPGVQDDLLKAVYATGTPLVVVLVNGSALAVNWAEKHAAAVVELWYPGEEGGTALADVLFGDYNPAGRLPVSFYKSVDDLPPFRDYAMAGHTYRFFEGEVLYDIEMDDAVGQETDHYEIPEALLVVMLGPCAYCGLSHLHH